MKVNLLVLFVFLTSASVASEPAGTSSIDGFVTGDAATMLAGVAIGVNELSQGRYEEAASNTGGYYLVNNLHSGAYSVWAEAKGYGCIIYPNIALFPGQRVHRNFHFETAKAKAKNCKARSTRLK